MTNFLVLRDVEGVEVLRAHNVRNKMIVLELTKCVNRGTRVIGHIAAKPSKGDLRRRKLRQSYSKNWCSTLGRYSKLLRDFEQSSRNMYNGRHLLWCEPCNKE